MFSNKINEKYLNSRFKKYIDEEVDCNINYPKSIIGISITIPENKDYDFFFKFIQHLSQIFLLLF